jgi:hypothetical protein
MIPAAMTVMALVTCIILVLPSGAAKKSPQNEEMAAQMVRMVLTSGQMTSSHLSIFSWLTLYPFLTLNTSAKLFMTPIW